MRTLPNLGRNYRLIIKWVIKAHSFSGNQKPTASVSWLDNFLIETELGKSRTQLTRFQGLRKRLQGRKWMVTTKRGRQMPLGSEKWENFPQFSIKWTLKSHLWGANNTKNGNGPSQDRVELNFSIADRIAHCGHSTEKRDKHFAKPTQEKKRHPVPLAFQFTWNDPIMSKQ